MLEKFTPYSTASPFFGTLPTWLRADDAERINAYQLYEQMYWNAPDVYSIQARDSQNTSPIYIPSARIVVEACNRFLAVNFDFVVDPVAGSDVERAALTVALRSLFIREEIHAKFNTQKRYGLIRGDSIIHIVGDPTKPQGSRLSVYEVDPASYFPIYDNDNPDKIVGVHLVDQHIDENTESTVIIRRQTYRKVVTDTPEKPSTRITSETTYWEMGKWDDRTWGGNKKPDLKLIRVVEPEHPLPEPIATIPVYHVKNIRNPADPFGSSELRGMETLANAINNAVSDEDLALALNGLGVYTTDATAPIDATTGMPGDWVLGPGVVVERTPGTDFTRVSGVTDVEPFQAHLAYIEAKMRAASGIGDIAAGKVDVAVAQSGIALRLQLQPILSANAEKEVNLVTKWDHIIYDLARMWFPAYEGWDFGSAMAGAVIGDPIPRDDEKDIETIFKMVDAGIMDAETARVELAKRGWSFASGTGSRVIEEQAALAAARASDPFIERIRREAGEEEPVESGAAVTS